MKDILRFVMIKVGLRAQNWPDDVEKAVLLEHIVTHFGGHTHEEIKLAFDMAVMEKLVDEEGEPVSGNCFENFSCAFFSKIMNSYRLWASETFKTISKEKTTMQPEPEVSMDDITMKDWWADVEKKVNDGYSTHLLPPMLYDWAERKNVLKFLKTKKEYFETAIEYRFAELVLEHEKILSQKTKDHIALFVEMRGSKSYSKSEYEILKSIAKRFVLHDMMKKESNDNA